MVTTSTTTTVENTQATQTAFESAKADLRSVIEGWTQLGGLNVHAFLPQLSNASSVREIEGYRHYFQQLARAGASANDCLRILEHPALPLMVGQQNVTMWEQTVQGVIRTIASTQTMYGNQESMRQLETIQIGLQNEERRLNQSADPLSQVNRAIDRGLMSGAVQSQATAETYHSWTMGSMEYKNEIAYLTGRDLARARYKQREAQTDVRAVISPPPPPALTDAIIAQTKFEAVPLQPIHITLHIERAKQGFRGFLAEDDNKPILLTILPEKDEQVVELGEQIRDAITTDLKMRKYFGRDKRVELTDSEFQQDWRGLAETGTAVLEKIFDRRSLEDLKRCLGRSGAHPVGAQISVRIETEDFFLPWEMLAWPEITEKESLDCRIWGFLYNITRSVIDAELTITRPRLMVDTLPDVLFFTLADDDPQVGMMSEFKQENQLNLTPVLPFTNRSEKKLRKQEVDDNLVEYLKKPLHVVHFGCHADGAKREEDARFRVNQNFYLTLYDFIERECTFIANPLVFLNACETGIFRGKGATSTTQNNPLAPKVAADFVRVFLRDLGACGVIATEYEIPSSFAAQFAKEFYSRFLNGGQSAGEALLQARQEIIRNRHNPLGLFFSAYLEPETRVSLNQPSRSTAMKFERATFTVAEGTTQVHELTSAFKNPPAYIVIFPLQSNATLSILSFAALKSVPPDMPLLKHPRLYALARSQRMDVKTGQEEIAGVLENYGIAVLTKRGAPVQVLVPEVLGEEYRPPVTINDPREPAGICPHCKVAAYRLVSRIKGKYVYYCSECVEQWR